MLHILKDNRAWQQVSQYLLSGTIIKDYQISKVLHLFNIPFHSLGENFEATVSEIIYSYGCRGMKVPMKSILHLLFTLLHYVASSSKGDFIKNTNFTEAFFVLSGGRCSTQHCLPNKLWSYKEGRDYTYDYQVEAISSMKGTTDEESSLKIGAKVTFQLVSPCNFLLKV